MPCLEIWSVGHSSHPLETFIALLAGHHIEAVADIRTVPKSRRHPHFHTDALAVSLAERGLDYRHLPLLGGWRAPAPGSVNDGWRNPSFQGYADYALTAPFAAGLAELEQLAFTRLTAIMCSEALWWRCHRRLVADRLLVDGCTVRHIGSDGRASAHVLTPFACLDDGGRLVYPAATRDA
jgi:uncharacterized protein (DUF488 family)